MQLLQNILPLFFTTFKYPRSKSDIHTKNKIKYELTLALFHVAVIANKYGVDNQPFDIKYIKLEQLDQGFYIIFALW